jgi:hypothetical protein
MTIGRESHIEKSRISLAPVAESPTTSHIPQANIATIAARKNIATIRGESGVINVFNNTLEAYEFLAARYIP